MIRYYDTNGTVDSERFILYLDIANLIADTHYNVTIVNAVPGEEGDEGILFSAGLEHVPRQHNGC